MHKDFGKMADVNLYLAVVVFLSALLTKFLHRLRNQLANAIAEKLVNESSQLSSLETEIMQLKEEIKKQENFEKRVDLVNKRLAKEYLLKQIGKRIEDKLSRTKRNCKVVLFLLIEASRVFVIFMNRSRPVFMFSPDVFWPIARVVSYPIGILGAVSPVVWGVACRQFFQYLLTIYDKR